MSTPTLAGFVRGLFDLAAITAALVVPPMVVVTVYQWIIG